MSEMLGAGMLAASGVHLALGRERSSARAVLRLLAEAVMVLAMLDICLLRTSFAPAAAWSALLLILAAAVLTLGRLPGEARDWWHGSALVLAAGVLAMPHEAAEQVVDHTMAMSGGSVLGFPHDVVMYVVLPGVAVYAAYAVLHALGADRGRLGPADRRGRLQVLASAVGLVCMTALMPM